MEISQLKFMLKEKSTEVNDLVGLFFLFFSFLGNALFGLGEREDKEKERKWEIWIEHFL